MVVSTGPHAKILAGDLHALCGHVFLFCLNPLPLMPEQHGVLQVRGISYILVE